MNKKIIYIIAGIFLLFGLVYVIADITASISETILTKERADALINSGFEQYTIKDIYSGEVFKRCIYQVDSVKDDNGTIINYTINGFHICSGVSFTTEKDADIWEKNKLDKIADMYKREIDNKPEIIEIKKITAEKEASKS